MGGGVKLLNILKHFCSKRTKSQSVYHLSGFTMITQSSSKHMRLLTRYIARKFYKGCAVYFCCASNKHVE